MPGTPDFAAIDNGALVLGLVTWLAERPRPYAEVIDAWRTSCPRLPVWEEAVDHGLVERVYTREAGPTVHVTPAGLEFVRAYGR